MTFLSDTSSRFQTKMERALPNPIWTVFIVSLVLSAISIYGTELPNRDGMLYIETASIFLKNGLTAARANFDWVFFPVCIAFVAKTTGLGLETAAYALNAVLFASTCATLVRITQIQFPSAAWYICIVALSYPSFNEQRSEIIREIGWWFFCLQTLLAAIRWQRQPSHKNGLTMQVMLACAALFRIEAIVFFGSIFLWQFATSQPWKQRLRYLSMLLGLPAFLGLVFLGLIASGQLDAGGRLSHYASAANPASLFAKFNDVSSQFSSTILNKYSADEAHSILFFGLLSTIACKFIAHNGIFLAPFAIFLGSSQLRRSFSAWQPQAHFFIVYTIVLAAFVTFNLFISGRYVIFLNILTMPLIALGLEEMFKRYPRWRHVFFLIIVLVSIANVISFHAKKTQFREAGQWLTAHPEIATRTYVEDRRTRYFAGPAFWTVQKKILSPEAIEHAVSEKKFDYVVIDLPKRNAEKSQWARSLNLEETKRFSNKTGDAVVVLQQKGNPPPVN